MFDVFTIDESTCLSFLSIAVWRKNFSNISRSNYDVLFYNFIFHWSLSNRIQDNSNVAIDFVINAFSHTSTRTQMKSFVHIAGDSFSFLKRKKVRIIVYLLEFRHVERFESFTHFETSLMIDGLNQSSLNECQRRTSILTTPLLRFTLEDILQRTPTPFLIAKCAECTLRKELGTTCQ